MTDVHFSRREFLRMAGVAAGWLVAGCTAAAPQAPQSSGASQTTPAEGSGTYEPADLRFWIWDDPQRDTVQARCQLTTDAYPEITVNVEVYPWPEYWPKLQTVLAAGTPPDMMWMDPAEFMARVSKGVFLNLQPFVDADAEFQEILQGCFPNNVANYLYKCELHGVPRNAATLAIGYNEDLIAEAGLQSPLEIQNEWTWETLREYATALTKRDGDRIAQWGYYGSSLGFHHWCPFVYSNGGSIIERETWRCVAGSPETIQAFQFLTDLILVDRVGAPPEATAEMADAALFQTGRIAMMPIGSWTMKNFNEMSELHYNVARIPKSPHTDQTVVHTIGLAACVANATAYPDQAAEVVKRLASVEAQRDIYGEEIPVRPDAAEVWSDPAVHPPSNRSVYLETTETGRPLPVHPTVPLTEFGKVISDHLTLIYGGREEVAAGLEAAESQINAMIDEAGPIPEGFEGCPSYLS